VKLTAHSPSFGYAGAGGRSLTVGGVAYSVPPGALVRLIRDAYRREIGYLLDGDRVHAFTAQGELDLTPELQRSIRRRYFTGRPLAGEQPTT
jgi:hypothetical protein